MGSNVTHGQVEEAGTRSISTVHVLRARKYCCSTSGIAYAPIDRSPAEIVVSPIWDEAGWPEQFRNDPENDDGDYWLTLEHHRNYRRECGRGGPRSPQRARVGM